MSDLISSILYGHFAFIELPAMTRSHSLVFQQSDSLDPRACHSQQLSVSTRGIYPRRDLRQP